MLRRLLNVLRDVLVVRWDGAYLAIRVHLLKVLAITAATYAFYVIFFVVLPAVNYVALWSFVTALLKTLPSSSTTPSRRTRSSASASLSSATSGQ